MRQTKPSTTKPEAYNKKKSLIGWILIAIALAGGIVLYYKQYPSPEQRREISVDGIFSD